MNRPSSPSANSRLSESSGAAPGSCLHAVRPRIRGPIILRLAALDAAGADRLRMPTALLRTNRRSVPWRVGACPESSDRRQTGRIFGEGQDDAGDLRKALKAAATALNCRRRFLFRGEDGSVSFYLQMPRGQSRKGTAKNGQRQRRTSMNGRRRRKRTGISTNG